MVKKRLVNSITFYFIL
jgi:hypothetical protein